VCNFGGGTFNLALVGHVGERESLRVIATGGANLGSEDLDRALSAWVRAQVGQRIGFDPAHDRGVWERLIQVCERAKIELCRKEIVHVELSKVDDTKLTGISIELSRSLLVDLARPILKQTFLVCDEVLDRAKLRARQVEAVFLAGGGSRSHAVVDSVLQYFGRVPRVDLDPELVSVIGAGLAAVRPALHGLFDQSEAASGSSDA
jgi:molecular chaperone DnaK (HSP70)